jgi:Fe-S cluster assembly iron-binding protein IscA
MMCEWLLSLELVIFNFHTPNHSSPTQMVTHNPSKLLIYSLINSGQPNSVFEKDGARVVVDTVSLDLINGSTVEYVEELIGSSFQVIGNPQAESSCGCKTSFNVSV